MPKPFRASDLHGSGANFRDLVHVIAGLKDPSEYKDPSVRLVIAGSREGVPPALVLKAINVWVGKYGKPDQVFSGKARGVDNVGEVWAKTQNIEVVPFPADWKAQGKAAGAIRNEQMAKQCTHGVVVHCGTPGSINMAYNLRLLNRPILEVICNSDGTFDIRT